LLLLLLFSVAFCVLRCGVWSVVVAKKSQRSKAWR
jgi:hypothetical protein